MKEQSYHWADLAAENLLRNFKDQKVFTCAAGITPSGTVHIGNFREVITVDLVSRALKSKGKKIRFIYSWDDYDRLRKIPKNFPKQDMLKKNLGKPIVDTPDPFGCHQSYAEHLERELEKELPRVGIQPEFLYQSKKYRNCEYADNIRYVLNQRKIIKTVLDKYRKDELPEDWIPLSVYCEKCNTDETKINDYNEEYAITYSCKCGHKNTIDFRKKGIVKLPWRIDWPMRWYHEKVAFEPGGKEHSTPGGSRDTAKEIFERIYSEKTPPLYLMYDYIIVKGVGGKMSSSLGNVITLKDTLEIYEPKVLRWIFAGTRPNTEFSISFDLDVLKNYEDFDKLERVYYGKEEGKEKDLDKQKRIYELSCVDKPPKSMPQQISFRHLTTLLQIYENNVDKVIKEYKIKNKERVICVKNWLDKYAPEEFRFEIVKKVTSKINKEYKEALLDLAERLKKKKFDEQTLFNEFYEICNKRNIKNTDFFKAAYNVLINKDKGPRLANFILTLGQERVVKLLNQLK